MKETLVLYLNCIGIGIEECLKKYYPDKFDIIYIKNFKLIDTCPDQVLPSDEKAIFNRANWLIYQPLAENKYGGLSTDAIMRENLNRKCKTLSIAYIYYNGYWPDGISFHGPRTHNLSYGHTNLHHIQLEASESDLKKIGTAIRKPDYIQQDIVNQSWFSIKTLQTKESLCDIRVAGDILAYYREQQLFWTVNHPSNFLFQIILDRILPCLGLKPVDITLDGEYLLSLKNDPVLPIYDQVKDTLRLQFVPRSARLFGADLEAEAYYLEYLKALRK